MHEGIARRVFELEVWGTRGEIGKMVGREEDGGWRHFIYVNRECAVRLGSPA